MEKVKKQRRFKAVLASAAACVMLLGGATAAYAADVGGIQRTIQIWIHGEQTEATIQFDGSGHYSMDYTDGNGDSHSRGGGGVAIAEDGTETPLSEEELLEELTAPEVRYDDDGSVWVDWFDQSTEITDRFENDVCYVKLINGQQTLYMTVKFGNGCATSPHKYIPAWEFN